jgi:hypothetical protein
MTVQFQFHKHCSMAFYQLTDAPIFAVELHGTFELEC